MYETFEISGMFVEIVLNYNKYYEYYFSNQLILWLDAPLVQYCIFGRNTFK